MEDELKWYLETHDLAWAFAQSCTEFARSNPYELVALDMIINTLMTELWDRGFSQSEIRSAFEGAIRDLPRYAAGEETRGFGWRSPSR